MEQQQQPANVDDDDGNEIWVENWTTGGPDRGYFLVFCCVYAAKAEPTRNENDVIVIASVEITIKLTTNFFPHRTKSTGERRRNNEELLSSFWILTNNFWS